MHEIVREIIFYIVVLLSNIIQAITGFAGTVLAMPFSLMLIGYETAKPVLNVLGILASIGVVMFNYKHINFKEFLKISLIMLIGMAIGFVVIRYVSISKNVLYLILASIVLLFVFLGIYNTFIRTQREEKDGILLKVGMYLVLIIAGLVHGMFVCGGPLLIIYASRKMKDKDEFRSTLSLSWVLLNSIILVLDITNGYYNHEVIGHMMKTIIISSAVLVLAVFIGNKIAKRLNRKVFMIITYILMTISAISLILNAVGVM